MFLVDNPSQAPGICFLCENNPEGQWVDTLKNYESDWANSLVGRKYVCQACAEDVARTLGWENSEHVEQAGAVLDHVEELKRVLPDRLDTALRDVLAEFNVLPTKEALRAPKKVVRGA